MSGANAGSNSLSHMRLLKSRNCSKAEAELGWQPTVTFEDGLRETIAWYQANQEWVAQVRSGEYLKYYDLQYANRLA